MKLPSFQFYPGDWAKDPNLRRCTHAAKGVWIDILCLMWENEERGVLATAGRAWSDEDIALAVGGDQAVVLVCLQELTLKGAAKRRADGALYSKRLVRDEHKRMLCVEAGKKGGNPNLKPTLKGQDKGDDKGAVKGDDKRNLTPSSSSSTSSSEEERESKKNALVPETPAAKSEKAPAKASGKNRDLEVFAPLQTPEFEAAWSEWMAYKCARQDVNPTEQYIANTRRANLDYLARKGSSHAVAVVRFSLAKGAKNLILDAPQEQLAAFTPKAGSPAKEITNTANAEFEMAVNALVSAVRENRLADAAELKKRASQAVQRAAFAVLSVDQKNVFSKIGKGEQ